MILMILKRKISVMILKVLFISRLCVYNVYDHFQRMATTINFQKKVRKKGEEVNNNESLVCDICSVICKSGANLRRQRTHDDREDSCDTCGISIIGLHKLMSHKRRHVFVLGLTKHMSSVNLC